MFVVEKINDILQTIYVYLPQELFIVILAGLILMLYESVKNGKKSK